MEIGDFLSHTRHIRTCFPHEETYRFSECAGVTISSFCKAFSIPKRDIVFHPTYTSRASSELIRLNARWCIVWDYHFAELIHSFNLATLTLQILDAGDPVVAASVTRDSVLDHFRACLFRFLSCQLFRHPQISILHADTFAHLACALRPPIRRDLAEHLEALRDFQWSYVLCHELAHIYFAGLSSQDKNKEFENLRGTIGIIKNIHRETHQFAKASPKRSQQVGNWWSGENDAYENMLTCFSEKMINNFDNTIAEEIVCDTFALRLAIIQSCHRNNIPFDFEDSGCVATMERARSAANSLNNFRLVLELLRTFWERLAQRFEWREEGGWSRSAIEAERDKALISIQEIFLRGSLGVEVAWYGNVASALGQNELRLDSPQLIAHAEKSKKERETAKGVEGFDESFTKAWFELKQAASLLLDVELIDEFFNRIPQRSEELSPQQALRKAQEIIGWQ